MRPSRKRTLTLLLGPPVGYMLLFFLIPVFVLFLYSFWQTENFEIVRTFTLANYFEVFTNNVNILLILKSIYIGLAVSAITILISFPAAYGLTFNKTLKRYKDYFLFLILIAMFSSYLIRVYAWRTILGNNGIINQALLLLGIVDEPLGFLLFSRFAVIISLVHILTPFTILPIFSALQNIDPSILQASRDLGANNVKTFFKVTLPLCRTGLVSGFLFSFILAAGDYLIPQLLGGAGGVMIGRVIADKFGAVFQWNLGAALTFITILLLFVTFFIVIYVFKLFGLTEKLGRKFNIRKVLANKYESNIGKFYKIFYKISYTFKKIPFFQIYIILFLIFLFFPPIIIILFSFNASATPTFPFTGVTLKWYKIVLTDTNILLGLRNSIIVAIVTAILAGIFGTSAAFAFKRFSFKLKNILYTLLVFPVSVPGLILGISLLSFFVFAKVPLSLLTVILGHLVFTIPFVFLNVSSSLENFNPSIEEAAKDLGANGIGVFMKITLPVIKSGIIGGMLIAFALSFDEFLVTFFVIGGGQNTIPMVIFSMLRRGVNPTVNAISSLILIVSLIFITIANKFTKLKVEI